MDVLFFILFFIYSSFFLLFFLFVREGDGFTHLASQVRIKVIDDRDYTTTAVRRRTMVEDDSMRVSFAGSACQRIVDECTWHYNAERIFDLLAETYASSSALRSRILWHFLTLIQP
jgi:hypothetical protein